MRNVAAGTALVAGALLLVGCGSTDTSSGNKEPTHAGAAVSSAPSRAGGQQESHQVTLEVQGTGQTQVMYSLRDDSSQQISLPWKKTATVTLTGAETRVGLLVSVTPGSVSGTDGQFKPAACTITVDGRKVADNHNGASSQGCEYTLK